MALMHLLHHILKCKFSSRFCTFSARKPEIVLQLINVSVLILNMSLEAQRLEGGGDSFIIHRLRGLWQQNRNVRWRLDVMSSSSVPT